MNPAQYGVTWLIRLYQLIVSPILATAMGPAGRCRFTPSCSHYALESVRLHGVVRGGYLGARRLCRCHPWGAFGEDLPPAVGSFKKAANFHGS